MTFRSAKNLCPNLQKPPLPSKIPGYAPAMRIKTEKFVLQLCKQRKLKKKEREIYIVVCGKCTAMSANAESLCCREKNEVSVEILNGNFLHF